MAAETPWEYYNQPANIVTAQIGRMSERADSSLSVANAAIAALMATEIDGNESSPPNLSWPGTPTFTIPRPDRPADRPEGEIDEFHTPYFDPFNDLIAQMNAILNGLGDVDDFTPPIASIPIPGPPAPINTSGRPTRPQTNDIVLPVAPNVDTPAMDTLLAINIPPPPAYQFPEFTDEDASFEGTPVNTVMEWSEPEYTSPVLQDLVREIRRGLAGGTGLHPDIEQALFDRDRGREDTIAFKRVREAWTTWASRGWDMPPGMLVEQVNEAQQDNQLSVSARARDVLAKSAEWEIENWRQSIAQGIGLETVLIDHFNKVVQRAFDAAKARLDAEVELFNSHVSLYNARQNARQINAQVFKTLTEQVIAKLEAWKTLLEGERLKGDLNETTARIFATRVEAVKNIIGIFEAKMRGAEIASQVERNKVEMYRADIQAWAEGINADKTRFDAYETQMRGSEIMARVNETAARAFAATLEAQASINNVKISAIRGKTEVIGAAVGKFVALLQAEREKIAAQATAITAHATAFQADTARYTAELGANTEEARLANAWSEARLRSNVAYYETRTRAYDQAMTRLIERARVVITALTSAGNMASQVAGGAMAAMHVQASLSGSGSASLQNSYSESHNYQYDVE